MLSTIQISQASIDRMQQRQLNQSEIDGFADILHRANEQGTSAKQFLESLPANELQILQKAHSLANPIHIASLSSEGAKNLLSQPDGSDLVDLNNDGLVEIGEARTIHFPPVNAPDRVKAAWDEATKDMSEMDKSILGLTMHHMIYGTHLDLPGAATHRPLPPLTQWNQANTQALYDYARSNLEFRVGMDGWTPYNQQLKQIYQDFFSALTEPTKDALFNTSLNNQASTGAASSPSAKTAESTDADESETDISINRLAEINQLLLDARIGIDREKIKELEKEMEAVRNDSNLSAKEKRDKLTALQQEIEQIIEEARRRSVEQEKRKASLHAVMPVSQEDRHLI